MSSVQVKENPTMPLHCGYTDEALSEGITGKKDSFFSKRQRVDHLRANRHRDILSKFSPDLTSNTHTDGEILLLKYFRVKFRNNFSQDNGA